MKLKSFVMLAIVTIVLGGVFRYIPWNKVLYRKLKVGETSASLPVGSHVLIMFPTNSDPAFVEAKAQTILAPKTLATIGTHDDPNFVFVKSYGRYFEAPILLIKKRLF